MLPHKIYKQVNPLAGAAAALFFLPLSRYLGLPRSLHAFDDLAREQQQ